MADTGVMGRTHAANNCHKFIVPLLSAVAWDKVHGIINTRHR